MIDVVSEEAVLNATIASELEALQVSLPTDDEGALEVLLPTLQVRILDILGEADTY